jgi:preprotein translocase subunit Sss1
MAKTVATILGAGFILVGLIGFLIPNFLGMHLSVAHHLVHIITGAAALYFGLAGTLGGARLFDIIFGAVYALLGIVGFLVGGPASPTLPGMAGMGTDSNLFRLIPGVLELGTMDHIVHILLGAIFLIGGLTTRATIDSTIDRT